MVVCFTPTAEDPRDISTYIGMEGCIKSFGALVDLPINGALVTHYWGFGQVSIFNGVVTTVGGLAVLIVKTNGKGVFAEI